MGESSAGKRGRRDGVARRGRRNKERLTPDGSGCTRPATESRFPPLAASFESLRCGNPQTRSLGAFAPWREVRENQPLAKAQRRQENAPHKDCHRAVNLSSLQPFSLSPTL